MKKKLEIEMTKDLKIKISQEVQTMLLGGQISTNDYKKLYLYSSKLISKYADDISYEYRTDIINMAIFKAQKDFNPKKAAKNVGVNEKVSRPASFVTYLFTKIQGEISAYRSKLNKSKKVLKSIIDEEPDIYKDNLKDGEPVDTQIIDQNSLPEYKEAKESYAKKIFSIKMAMGNLPLFHQNLLKSLFFNNEQMNKFSVQQNLTIQELNELRNKAMTIVLQKVLRNKYLNDIEKMEIKKEHNLL